MEIIKREFEPHQKALWAVEDEEAKKEMIKKSTKGKKRAREEEDDGVQSADVGQSQGDNANAALQAAEVANDAQKAASATNKEKKKKHRPVLRVYQYNLLDAYERLPGASTSTTAAEEAQSDNDAENTLAEGGGTTSTNEAEEAEDDEQRENLRIQADLVQNKIKAAKSLDEAIKTHVMRVQKK